MSKKNQKATSVHPEHGLPARRFVTCSVRSSLLLNIFRRLKNHLPCHSLRSLQLPELHEKKFPVRLRRKMPRRKRPRPADGNGVFSTFTLNKDPDCSQYMPYDDVSYPKLQAKVSHGGDAMSELESMWMVGFLHHNKKTKDEEQVRRTESRRTSPSCSCVLTTSTCRSRRSSGRSSGCLVATCCRERSRLT